MEMLNVDPEEEEKSLNIKTFSVVKSKTKSPNLTFLRQ